MTNNAQIVFRHNLDLWVVPHSHLILHMCWKYFEPNGGGLTNNIVTIIVGNCHKLLFVLL